MKFNLKNPMWITNPDYAKKEFEKELREKLGKLKIYGWSDKRLRLLIEEILGEA